MKKISLIIPCYNEEDVLKLTYDEIINHLPSQYSFQFIMVDDGSKDKTLAIMSLLSKQDNRVKYLSFSRNFGKEAALLAGLETAKKTNSDAAIIIDADLQDPHSLIPQMLNYYEQGFKHVYTKHRTRVGESKLKTFFALSFYKVYAFLTKNKTLAKGARDFCLIDRQVIEAMLAVKDYKRFTKGLYNWIGFEKKCLEFDYVPRAKGTTKWNFNSLFEYALLGIGQFSQAYLLVTTFLMIIAFGFVAFDVIQGIVNNWNFNSLRLDIFIFLTFVGIHTVLKLLYDIRDQGLNRPIYITKDNNIDA
ncbi:MAG: glycosyltransferase family 2 protein [Bacilli bacterium]